MAADLSTYHQRTLAAARKHVADLAEMKTTEMTDSERLMWLTRMEMAARGLLHIVDLLTLAAELDIAAKGRR